MLKGLFVILQWPLVLKTKYFVDDVFFYGSRNRYDFFTKMLHKIF